MKIPFTKLYVRKWPIMESGRLLHFTIGPSKKFSQLALWISWRGIKITNNCGGQLGPNAIQILLYWKPFHFSKYVYSYPETIR